MFILCPHCQFLVAIEPTSGLPPDQCPRCRESLRGDVPASVDTDAALAVAVADVADVDDVVESASVPAPVASIDPDAVAEAVTQAHTDVELESVQTASDAYAAEESAGTAIPDDVVPGVTAPGIEPPTDANVTAPPRASLRSRAPSFAHRPAAARAPSRGARPVLVVAGLALLLVLQVLLADRARLAEDARWRPLIGAVCGVLRCTLPAWHEPEAFIVVARDVRPARPGVLHVTAAFRNDARWTQDWPALHLALQDVDGRTIGARVFAPADYLGGRATKNGLAPGQVGNVAFDVAEPPGTVVAFTFDFR